MRYKGGLMRLTSKNNITIILTSAPLKSKCKLQWKRYYDQVEKDHISIDGAEHIRAYKISVEFFKR